MYIPYLRTALNECSMLLALLAIRTNAEYSWPEPLVLCRRQEMVLCRQPIGAHGAFVCVVGGWHWRSCASGEIEREVHNVAPKIRPHARACAHTRPRHRRGVGERPHARGSVERTASLAVAKTRCQTRWPWRAEWPLQGIPSEKAASGGCGPISTNHMSLFGLSCTRFYPAPCFGHISTRYSRGPSIRRSE